MAREYKDYTNDERLGKDMKCIASEIENIEIIEPKRVSPKKVEPEIVLEMPLVRKATDPESWLTEDKLMQLQKWGEEGLSYDLIARNMGISRNMLQRWRNEYYAMDEAILLGREVATGHVEEALYKKATGYYIDEVVIDAKGGEHIVKKYIQPDIKAIQYYLNNRCKDRWSGNIQHQTNIQVPIIFGEDSIRK